MKTLQHSLNILVLTLLACPSQQALAITLLHEFTGGSNDGALPFGGVTIAGSNLYGSTSNGGDDDGGTLYKMQLNGSGYHLLHEFPTNYSPAAKLTLSGVNIGGYDFFYGTTFFGGTHGGGTVFSFSGYDFFTVSPVYEFGSTTTEGKFIVADVTLAGSTLYGTTLIGGNNGDGTIFSMNENGSNFTQLHDFALASDGGQPSDGVIVDGTILYGTTPAGGTNNQGTIYSMNLDGTDFTVLHEFAGGTNDGANPQAKLTLVGSTLYGTTSSGGDNDDGTIFAINTNGSGFSLLHEFLGGSDDGEHPSAELINIENTLFGTTLRGGDNNRGTVFSLNTNGTGFNLLHEFAGGVDDGESPWAGLSYSNSTLYGTTRAGGDSNLGTVYAILIPEPSSMTLLLTSLSLFVARKRTR